MHYDYDHDYDYDHNYDYHADGRVTQITDSGLPIADLTHIHGELIAENRPSDASVSLKIGTTATTL